MSVFGKVNCAQAGSWSSFVLIQYYIYKQYVQLLVRVCFTVCVMGMFIVSVED